MENTINYINNINFYASAVRKSGKIEDKEGAELIFEAMGLDYIRIATELARVNLLTRKVKRCKKKDVDLENKQNEAYLNVRETLLSTKCISKLSEISVPNFVENLVNNNPAKIAYNQHGLIFNKTIELVESEPELVKAYDQELRKINLSYKLIQHLNKAVVTKDEALYEKVNNIIKEGVLKLPRVMSKKEESLRFIVEGMVRSKYYFSETHPNYDWGRAFIYYPSIYIAKAILSRTLNSIKNR